MTSQTAIPEGLSSCSPVWSLSKRVRRHGESGATLVEFALICLLFLGVLFGICAFGHALYAYHFVSHAAKEASRYAAVRGSTCGSDSSCTAANSASGTAGPTTELDLQQFVRNAAPPGIDPDQITTTAPCGTADKGRCGVSPADTCAAGAVNQPGCTVEVQVSYSFSFLFPLVRSGPLTVSSTSRMVIAH